MKNILVILIVSVIIGFFTVPNASSTTTLGTRIVNGTAATNRTQFAYQVSFRIKSINYHFCGGTIISERAILTAAHCFQTYNSSIVVAVVGDLDTSKTTTDTITMELASVVTHADYNATTVENDVAVALTKQNFTWSSTVYFLPLANLTPVSGAECYISGWGTIFYNGPTSSVLLYAMVPIINNTVCSRLYGNSNIFEGMVCAGYLDGTADACNGDSGGPLACGGVVAGIVSWGYGCAYAPYPGVYTDVAYFKNWIETQIENFSSNESSENLLDSGHSAEHYPGIHVILFICAILAK